MMKVKRYLRGSGRFFAFVFIASVIWLLFDMAALRLSINDANSQILKEQVIKERELFRQKSREPEVKMRRRFKSPVQRVNVTQEAKGPLHRDINIDQVYRQGGRRHEQVMRDKNRMSLNQEGDNVPRADGLRSVAPKKQEDILRSVAANKKAVDLDVKVDKLKKYDTEALKAVDVKVGEKVKAKEEKGSEPEVVETHVEEAKINNGQEQVRVFNKSDISVLKKPVVKQAGEGFKDNSIAVKKTSVHQVLSLDVTLTPRDPNAVGQFGVAAHVASNEDEQVKKRWDEGHFNVYLSDQIPIDRAIPDVRPAGCAQKQVHDDLPATSVIFCFVDEVWSTLLRSVHSVLNRSPPHLIEEIILVDDFSTREYLKEPLDKYMSQFPKVRIVRLKERQGLIRARLAGAAVAKGEVLTFLDSHVECNVGWLEPLLERVYLDRKKVPCPVIDVISDKDMSYLMIDNFQRGIFKWPLVFGWSPMSPEYLKENNITASDPFRCPVMAGGLFSIDKNYFFELGTYDRGLDVWGGENMEISFKIWMCGGEIEIIPCSRVGHIFRGQNPYKFPKDRQKTVERNLARVAEVWLDEYKDVFYGHGYLHMLDKKTFDVGNLTEQIDLRKKLKCRSFKWYLENVFPDMKAPLVKAQGMLFNQGLRKCLTLQNGSLFFETCALTKPSQQFNYTWMMQIRQQDTCVVPQQQGDGLALQPCNNINLEQRWFHKTSNSPMAEHLMSEVSLNRVCLEAEPDGDSVCVKPCVPINHLQKWQFTQYNS